MCTLMVICIGNVSKEIIWLQRRKMENVFEDNEHIVCFFWCITPVVCFFCCITPVVEKNKEKARSRRNNSGRSEEDGEEFSNNDCDISFWIAFNQPEYGISSFEEHEPRELGQEVTILYLCIVNTVTSIVCSIAIYLQFIQVISKFQTFLGNWNKLSLDTTVQSLFIVLKKIINQHRR